MEETTTENWNQRKHQSKLQHSSFYADHVEKVPDFPFTVH